VWHEEEYLSTDEYIVKREGFYPFSFLFNRTIERCILLMYVLFKDKIKKVSELEGGNVILKGLRLLNML